MHQADKVRQWLKGLKTGVEIGAFKSPIPGIKPIYVDKYAMFANEPCLADFEGEAISLPFESNSLSYVASSHVLEHVANPVEALLEWYRVLKPGGIIYMVVPDRRYTWDKYRALTTVEHMMNDYYNKVTSVDGAHIDEFIDKLDWPTYSPQTPSGEIPFQKTQLRELYWSAIHANMEINMHFHVFEPSNISALIRRISTEKELNINWRIVDIVEKFPDENPIGVLCVIKVEKGISDFFQSKMNQWYYRKSALLSSAKIFEKKAKN